MTVAEAVADFKRKTKAKGVSDPLIMNDLAIAFLEGFAASIRHTKDKMSTLSSDDLAGVFRDCQDDFRR